MNLLWTLSVHRWSRDQPGADAAPPRRDGAVPALLGGSGESPQASATWEHPGTLLGPGGTISAPFASPNLHYLLQLEEQPQEL